MVCVQGINIPVPTRLLIQGSPYWAGRVTEHAQACRAAAMVQRPSLLPVLAAPTSPPIILDESMRGMFFSAYEFTVYVGLLQAEEYRRVALSMGVPAPEPLHGPLFRSFSTAGMPLPSAQTLSNVSRMASFFGRTDLARRVPVPPLLPQWASTDYSAPLYLAMQGERELQGGTARRREHQAHEGQREQWRRRQLCEQRERAMLAQVTAQRVDDEEPAAARAPVTHVATHTSYSDVIAGIVPMAGPPLTTAAAGTLSETVPKAFPRMNDFAPIVLPRMLSPLPSYFCNDSPWPPTPLHPPPTPRLPETMEPPLLPSAPPMDLNVPGFPASGSSSSSALFSTPDFFPQHPAAPRVDASQIEVAPVHGGSSQPQSRFPARFQSGRAATRRHQPQSYHHSDGTPRSLGSQAAAVFAGSEAKAESATPTQQQQQQPRRRRLPDGPGQGPRGGACRDIGVTRRPVDEEAMEEGVMDTDGSGYNIK
ncbi:hypothetical protein SCUCBS95973_000916 [Sporothrix curviconia]|uniref:Uncharacterized protein n=1 Tax=Sporothrix curviconia TaxID=1260050 RepID=A0ABP0AU83_9PEZI